MLLASEASNTLLVTLVNRLVRAELVFHTRAGLLASRLVKRLVNPGY